MSSLCAVQWFAWDVWICGSVVLGFVCCLSWSCWSVVGHWSWIGFVVIVGFVVGIVGVVVVVEVVVVIKVFVGAAPIDEVVVSISHSTAIISSFLIGLLFLFSSE